MIRNLVLGAAAAVALAGAASAQPAAPLVVGVDTPATVHLDKVQYLYSGHGYCWYDGGWRGPGFYWCGHAWHRGFGWGGPAGWRGWAYGPGYWRGGVWTGPRGYAHREWGGWHDGWRDHGHWRHW